MDTLIQKLLLSQTKDKIQKPDCSTRTGRSLLAFYLQTKFKQIINYDKKADKELIKSYRTNFLEDFTQRLISRPQDRILICLSGQSASGKSTICKKILSCIGQLNLPISIISADNYFNDISDKIEQYGNFDLLRDSGYDVDAPSSFNLELLKSDIKKLQEGKNVYIPQYLVNGTGKSIPNSIFVEAKKIIIVEGMCTIYDEIIDAFDIKVYIDINEQERKKRFLNRAKQRNQDEANAYKHWEYILKAGKKYVEKNRSKCDIVINGECDLEYFTHMVEYINLITNNFYED